MGYTRASLRDVIQVNLAEKGLSTGFFSVDELNESIQDAYNEVVAKSYCLIKNTTLNFVNDTNYYAFLSLGVADYMGTVGIFNNNTNRWLFDNITARDLDRLRRDWETWYGQPLFWCQHSLKYIIITPKLLTATGNFKLHYYAFAPTLTSDSDTFLIADDMQTLLELYCTADLLETAEEASKAIIWWDQYFGNLNKYKTRCIDQARSDLLFRV